MGGNNCENLFHTRVSGTTHVPIWLTFRILIQYLPLLNLQARVYLSCEPVFDISSVLLWTLTAQEKCLLTAFFAKTRMSGSPDHKGRNRLQSVSTKICRSCFWGKWLKWGRMVWWSKAWWTSMRDLAKVSRNAAEVLRRDSSSERAIQARNERVHGEC